MFDIHKIYAKLANRESVTDADVQDVLRELIHYRKTASFLASVHAANLESLPKSASASSRNRHLMICRTAAALIAGDRDAFPSIPPELDWSIDRCKKAAGI